jgi:hypothetical protein
MGQNRSIRNPDETVSYFWKSQNSRIHIAWRVRIGMLCEEASKIAGCRGIIPLPGAFEEAAPPQGFCFSTPLRECKDKGAKIHIRGGEADAHCGEI